MLPTLDEVREDPEFIRDLNLGMITMTVLELREMGEAYAAFDRTEVFDLRGLSRPTMPPFVGTAEEAEALAVYLATLDAPTREGGVR